MISSNGVSGGVARRLGPAVMCLFFFLVRGTLFYSILSEMGFKAVGFLLVSVHSDPGENGKKGGGSCLVGIWTSWTSLYDCCVTFCHILLYTLMSI